MIQSISVAVLMIEHKTTMYDPVIQKYTDLYRKVYHTEPRSVQRVDHEFVMVNDMLMKMTDLELLNHELEKEYRKQRYKQRNAVFRLINWLKRS
jgi:hypothetical protein